MTCKKMKKLLIFDYFFDIQYILMLKKNEKVVKKLKFIFDCYYYFIQFIFINMTWRRWENCC